eukprot:gene417-451_t
MQKLIDDISGLQETEELTEEFFRSSPFVPGASDGEAAGPLFAARVAAITRRISVLIPIDDVLSVDERAVVIVVDHLLKSMESRVIGDSRRLSTLLIAAIAVFAIMDYNPLIAGQTVKMLFDKLTAHLALESNLIRVGSGKSEWQSFDHFDRQQSNMLRRHFTSQQYMEENEAKSAFAAVVSAERLASQCLTIADRAFLVYRHQTYSGEVEVTGSGDCSFAEELKNSYYKQRQYYHNLCRTIAMNASQQLRCLSYNSQYSALDLAIQLRSVKGLKLGSEVEAQLLLCYSHFAGQFSLRRDRPAALLALYYITKVSLVQKDVPLSHDLVDDLLIQIIRSGNFHEISSLPTCLSSASFSILDAMQKAAVLSGDLSQSIWDLLLALRLYQQHFRRAAEVLVQQLHTLPFHGLSISSVMGCLRLIDQSLHSSDRSQLNILLTSWWNRRSSHVLFSSSRLLLHPVCDHLFVFVRASSFSDGFGDSFPWRGLVRQSLWVMWFSLVCHYRTLFQSLDVLEEALVSFCLGDYLNCEGSMAVFFSTIQPGSLRRASSAAALCHLLWQAALLEDRRNMDILFATAEIICKHDSENNDFARLLFDQLSIVAKDDQEVRKRFLHMLRRLNRLDIAVDWMSKFLPDLGEECLSTDADFVLYHNPRLQPLLTSVFAKHFVRA